MWINLKNMLWSANSKVQNDMHSMEAFIYILHAPKCPLQYLWQYPHVSTQKNMHEEVIYQLQILVTSGEEDRAEGMCSTVLATLNYLFLIRKMKQIWLKDSICSVFEESTSLSVYRLFPLLLYQRSGLASSHFPQCETQKRKTLSFKYVMK